MTLQGSAWLSNMYILGGVDQTPSDISMSSQPLTSEETSTLIYIIIDRKINFVQALILYVLNRYTNGKSISYEI